MPKSKWRKCEVEEPVEEQTDSGTKKLRQSAGICKKVLIDEQDALGYGLILSIALGWVQVIGVKIFDSTRSAKSVANWNKNWTWSGSSWRSSAQKTNRNKSWQIILSFLMIVTHLLKCYKA